MSSLPAVVAGPVPQAPLLDIATHSVTAYPGCGEAVVQNVSALFDPTPEQKLNSLLRHGPRAPRGMGDPEASESSSVRRARTMVRRWCVQNKVDRGITLTCKPERMVYDIASAWELINTFRIAMRAIGMDCMLIVPERCKDGQIHFHGAIPRWVDHQALEDAWGHGWVLIKKPKTSRGTGARGRSRILAGYLSKYLGKEFGKATEAEDGASRPGSDASSPPSPTIFNGKRYTTSRGFTVRKVSTRTTSMFDAYRVMLSDLGATSLELVWTSSAADDWCGPPTAMFHAS
jgi:hypothetical protein